MKMLIDIIFTEQFFSGVLRLMTPIIFASLAALMSKRAGITNMAIEGTMLFAALFAVIGSALTQSVIVGVLSAIAVAVVISMTLAYFKINMKTDELLVAIALNLLATGATIFVLYLVSGERGTSAALDSLVVPRLIIPGLMEIPILGNMILGHNILVYVALLSVAVVNYILFKTPLGLRIRAVGGNPDAAVSVGVSVVKTQYIALIISGLFSGLGGAFMSMGYMTVFTRNMTAGRGYIGLAAANIGNQSPVGALLASLLFGIFDALGNNMQTLKIPVEFIYMIPYVATIVAYSIASYRVKTEKERIAKKLLKLDEGSTNT
ncbi:ABC transporter permease [Erysipelothrix larvae]|uniref:ABC transporter permease n=1 Tax=Erysipelothrix larvae TaxID=1514105 RepID=A0A0X8GZG8_9FIRM|nr:ABC transporter permease [Erysipelothrix larvae]AMC93278.1 ABC transporter permease [Erysipelothrix larvae]